MSEMTASRKGLLPPVGRIDAHQPAGIRGKNSSASMKAPVGEIDPAKATDYADTVLMVNIYDTLVSPRRARRASSRSSPPIGPRTARPTPSSSATASNSIPAIRSPPPMWSSRTIADRLGQGLGSLFVDRVVKVEAVDPLSVKFTLKEPYAPFLASLVRLQVVDSKTVIANKKDGKYGDNGDYGERGCRPMTPDRAPTASRARTRSRKR